MPAALFRRLRTHPKRDQARKWIESILSLAGVAAVQLAGFILLARMLGATDYAVIVAVASIVAMLLELVGLGCGDTLIRAVAREPGRFREMAGQALRLIAWTLPPTAALGIGLVLVIYRIDVPPLIPAGLVLSELVSARALALAEHMAIAHRAIRLANVYRVGPQLIRIALIGAGMAAGVRSIEGWFAWQFVFGMIVGPACVAHALRRFGRPLFGRGELRLGDNLLFAATQQLRAMQFNVDRLFVGNLGNQALLGQYGVAARLVQYSLLPVQSVLRMTYPAYFRHGSGGIAATARFGVKVLGLLLALALPVTLFLLFAADLLAAVLGPGYRPVADLLRLLSPLPLLAAAQYAIADILTGANLQTSRTATLAVGVLGIGLAALLGATLAGVPGVAIGVVAANGLLAIAFALVVRWQLTRVKGRSDQEE